LLKPAAAAAAAAGLNEYDAATVDKRRKKKKKIIKKSIVHAGPPKTVITENIFFLPSSSSSLYLLTFLFKLFLLKFDIFALLVCRYTMSLFFLFFFPFTTNIFSRFAAFKQMTVYTKVS